MNKPKADNIQENEAEEISGNILSERETTKINDCAEQCISLLGDIVRHGLVRIPETLPENLEAAAVRCHSLKMADAERAVRELGGRLSDCLERRASFNLNDFSAKLCACVRLLETLTVDFITPEQLGVFRTAYTPYNGILNILPIGQRELRGGEYEGTVYYFLNTDEEAEQRFLSYADIRPVFYRDGNKGGRYFSFSAPPWNLPMSLEKMMKSQMTLANAKISGGKLSSSQETYLMTHSAAKLDCNEVKNLIYTDFQRIAVEIYEKSPETELERLVFVRPAKCTANFFDKYSQQHIIETEDFKGRKVRICAKYSAENQKFINQLDKKGKQMLNEPNTKFTVLALAYVEKGELTLFPIEIYDFIGYVYPEEYRLPEEYRNIREIGRYCGRILEVFDKTEEKLTSIIRSGLQSDIKNDSSLQNLLFSHGLKGLNSMIDELVDEAAAYRHSTERNCADILLKMRLTDEYLNTGRKKLDIIGALNKMQSIQ